MGFDVDSLVGKTVETTVEIGSESAVISYDPNVLTKARVLAADNGDEEFLDFFCALVKDWDVTQGGAKVPLKPASLEPLPIILLRRIFWHIMRESSVGDMGKLSSGTSSRRVPQDRKARSPRRPSGTATSRSRDT